MPRANLRSVVRYMRQALGAQKAPAPTDAQLLQQFCSQRDEEAFAVLVYRHGGLVRAVCRRVLHHDQDAEDAFQATFLVFASKAHSIRKRVSVVSWLHGVAYRVAMNAKRARRLPVLDSSAAAGPGQDEPAKAAALREVQAIVDEELNKLPEKYRAPFVLCCLEGKSRAEAAAELSLLEGTVSSRMARARQQMQQRLTRRGVVLSAALCAIDLTRSATPAIGPAFADRTAMAAVAFAAGLVGTSGPASAPVIALAKGVLIAMSTTSKLKIATALVLIFGFLATTGAIARQVLAPAAGEEQAKTTPTTPPNQAPVPGQIDDLQQGEDFLARVQKISKGSVTLSKQGPSSPVSRPTIPIAKGGKILEGKLDRKTNKIEAGPEIEGGLENERLRLAVSDGLVARVITEAGGKAIKEIRMEIPEKLSNQKPAPLVVHTGPRGQLDSDPLPPHAIARLGSLRFRHNLTNHSPQIGAAPLIAVSPDGKRLASARFNIVQVWETATGLRLAEWSFRDRNRSNLSNSTGFGLNDDQPVAFSPDGKHLAMYCDSSKLRILAVETGNTVKEIMLGEAPEGGPAGRRAARTAQLGQGRRTWTPYLSYLPDGKQIIVEDGDGHRVRLLNLESGESVRDFRGNGENFFAVALSPNGLVLAMGDESGTIKIRDVATGNERIELKTKKGAIGPIAFSPDSKVLAVADRRLGASRDGNIYLWDIVTGQLIHTLAALAPSDIESPVRRSGYFKDETGNWRLSAAHGLSFSPDGKRLASSHVSWVVVWDPTSGKEIRRLPSEDYGSEDSKSARFLPDSGAIFMSGRNVFHYFDAATGLPFNHFEGHHSGITSIAISPDGKQIATASAVVGNGGLLVWDVRSRQIKLKTDGQSLGWRSNLAFSADGKSLAAARVETVFVWDTRTGEQRLMIPGQENALFNSALAVAKDGSKLAFGTGQGWITRYDLPNGKEQMFQRLTDDNIMEMALSRDMRLVAGNASPRGGGGRRSPAPIQFWDVETGKVWTSIPRSRESIDRLEFSPDGRTLLEAPGQGQTIFWEVATGSTRYVLSSPGATAAAFSHDGRRVALAEQKQSLGIPTLTEVDTNPSFAIRILDLVTGESSVPLTGHRGPINDLAFSADGKFLASASDDTTALLWELKGLFQTDGDTTLVPDDRKSAWDDLRGQADRAYWSMWRLARDPGAIELLRKELPQATATTDPALQLRGLRAIEVLEKMNTPAARELLEKLARGRADSPVTMEAKRPLSGIIEFGTKHPSKAPPAEIAQPRRNVPRQAQNVAVIDAEKGAAKAIEKLGGRFTTGPDGHIVTVTLIGTKTTDADLKQLHGLENLESLLIGITNVTDAGLEELKQFKNLRTLGLRQTKVTSEGARKLKEALPQCRIMRSAD